MVTVSVAGVVAVAVGVGGTAVVVAVVSYLKVVVNDGHQKSVNKHGEADVVPW